MEHICPFCNFKTDSKINYLLNFPVERLKLDNKSCNVLRAEEIYYIKDLFEAASIRNKSVSYYLLTIPGCGPRTWKRITQAVCDLLGINDIDSYQGYK